MSAHIRIASWNILNDWAVPKHATQTDRSDLIINEIKSIYTVGDKFIMFLCEVSNLEIIDTILKETGLVAVGKPINYRSNPKEFSMFLADPITAKVATTEAIEVIKEPRNKVLYLKLPELSLIGCHSPWRLIRHTRSKNKHMSTILATNPDIFMGDLNATPIFITRLRASRHYKETHAKNRPPFPSKEYRGKNIPLWLPTISIDAIYHKPEIQSSNAQYSLNYGSDHPLIWADFEL